MSTRPHYKLAVLVLASQGDPVYDHFRQIWLNYYKLHPDVLVHFVFGASGTQRLCDRDFRFTDIPETYTPGMMKKTLRAWHQINTHYKYDHMLRTNLSTFWIWDRALARMSALPQQGLVAGTPRSRNPGPASMYIAGLDMVLSRDMTELALDHATDLCAQTWPEDLTLTDFFRSQGFAPQFSRPRNIHLLEHLHTDTPLELRMAQEINEADRKNCDHFRIKNTDREQIDCPAASILLEHYYGKYCPPPPL